MAEAEKEVVSDPCQVPVKDKLTNKMRPCGVVTRSLTSHLRVHNTKNMKVKDKWTARRYRKEFPDFSLGQPTFVQPPEVIEKWSKARDKHNEDKQVAKQILSQSPEPEYHDSLVKDSYKEAIQQRFEELWDQVNRDLPARQWAMEAARAEQRIEEINRRYDSAFARGDYKRLEPLMKELIAQQKVLKDCMDFLDLTVKNRREKNQLGNDTVAQLISNFGATLRRMSPEKRQTFNNRVNEVRRVQAERIRQKLLSEILEENIAEVVEQRPMSEADYDAEIKKFVARADDI